MTNWVNQVLLAKWAKGNAAVRSAALEVRTVPVTAPAAERPCQLRTYHAPEPVITQGHHRFPVYLQNRKYGHIVNPELMWLCGTDHDSVHAWIYWLMGERAQPSDPGRLVRAEAEHVMDWWRSN